MKPFDPIEYNIECAKFIGATSWQAYPENKDLKQNGILWNFPKEITLGLYRNYSTSGLKFNSDWGWRMEVIKKIESLDDSDKHYKWEDTEGINSNFMGYEVEVEKDHCSVWLNLSLDPSKIISTAQAATKEEATDLAIWEFIQWHKKY